MARPLSNSEDVIDSRDAADALRDWITDDQMPELAGFPEDLVNCALGRVRWLELAISWLRDVEAA